MAHDAPHGAREGPFDALAHPVGEDPVLGVDEEHVGCSVRERRGVARGAEEEPHAGIEVDDVDVEDHAEHEPGDEAEWPRGALHISWATQGSSMRKVVPPGPVSKVILPPAWPMIWWLM